MGILLLWLGLPVALLVEVCCLRASYNMVQAVKSICPVSCHFWVTAVCRNNILARKKKGFFIIEKSMRFFLYLILFAAFVFCSYLGPFEYCSSMEHFIAACCAVSHVSAKCLWVAKISVLTNKVGMLWMQVQWA